MKQKINFILILLLLIPIFINIVNAISEVEIDEVDFGGYSNTQTLTATHPSSSASISARGHVFRPLYDGCNITVVNLCVYKSASSLVNYTIRIYNTTGLYGSTCVPTGEALVSSEPVNTTIFPLASVDNVGVNWTFTSNYTLYSNQTYGWALEATSGYSSTAFIGIDNVNPIPHLGNDFSYYSSAWYPVTTSDICYRIYGNADLSNMGYINISTGDTIIIDQSTTTNVSAGTGTDRSDDWMKLLVYAILLLLNVIFIIKTIPVIGLTISSITLVFAVTGFVIDSTLPYNSPSPYLTILISLVAVSSLFRQVLDMKN